MDIYRQILCVVLLIIYIGLEALHWLLEDVHPTRGPLALYAAKTFIYTAAIYLAWVAN